MNGQMVTAYHPIYGGLFARVLIPHQARFEIITRVTTEFYRRTNEVIVKATFSNGKHTWIAVLPYNIDININDLVGLTHLEALGAIMSILRKSTSAKDFIIDTPVSAFRSDKDPW